MVCHDFMAKIIGSTATVYNYLWNYGFIPKVLNLSKKASENYGGLDSRGHPATLDGKQIASAFNSFYNGYIYTTSDSYVNNSIYNLIKAKKVSEGVGSSEEFYETVMSSYSNIDMEDDTMFGWPCGLGFCGTELTYQNL